MIEAHVLVGVLVLIVGFGFHWLGQLLSLLNWELATRLGLQEPALLPEYRVYEQAFAVADVSVGWIYSIAGIGLILDADWGYRLAAIPGALLLYHSISAWMWEGYRRASGHPLWSNALRIGWCAANFITGALALLAAWTAA